MHFGKGGQHGHTRNRNHVHGRSRSLGNQVQGMKLIPIWRAVDFGNGFKDLTEALAHIRVVCGQLLQGGHLLGHRKLVHQVDEWQEDARGLGKVVV